MSNNSNSNKEEHNNEEKTNSQFGYEDNYYGRCWDDGNF